MRNEEERGKDMKWEQLLNEQITDDYSSQVQTDIECPKCGRKIYLDTRVVLSSYPCKYQYWCSCGWSGFAHVKWNKYMGS